VGLLVAKGSKQAHSSHYAVNKLWEKLHLLENVNDNGENATIFYCAGERYVAENRAGESMHVYEFRCSLLYSNVSQPGFRSTALVVALEIME